MKKLKLTKVIASTLLVASVLALNPIGVSASWKQDSNGWWYTEGYSWNDDSWVTGWKNIDGNWYYFYSNGYMAHDTTIDGRQLGSDGAWINTLTKDQSWTVDGQWEFTINSVTTTKKEMNTQTKTQNKLYI